MEPNQQADHSGNQTTQPVASQPQAGGVNPVFSAPVQPHPQPEVVNPVNLVGPTPSTHQTLPTSNPLPSSSATMVPEEVSPQSPDGVIRWVASESIQYNRGSVWFIVLALFSISLILLDIFLLKYYSFSAVVLVVFISLVINAVRPPRKLNYAFSPEQGLYINNQIHSLENFSSFGVITEDNQPFIKLIPAKRFGAGLNIYFPEELGEVIVDAFGGFLPMTDAKPDILDIIIRKLKL